MSNDKILKDVQLEMEKILAELDLKSKNKELSDQEIEDYKNRISNEFINSVKNNGFSSNKGVSFTQIEIEKKKKEKLNKISTLQQYYFDQIRLLRKEPSTEPIEYITTCYMAFVYQVVSDLSGFPIVTNSYYFLKESCLLENKIPDYYYNKHFIKLSTAIKKIEEIPKINTEILKFTFSELPYLMEVPINSDGVFYEWSEICEKFSPSERFHLINKFATKEFDLDNIINNKVSSVVEKHLKI